MMTENVTGRLELSTLSRAYTEYSKNVDFETPQNCNASQTTFLKSVRQPLTPQRLLYAIVKMIIILGDPRYGNTVPR